MTLPTWRTINYKELQIEQTTKNLYKYTTILQQMYLISDKATSNLRLEPDWATNLQICDLIRQNDVTYVIYLN